MIVSSIVDDEVIDIDKVGSSEVLISRNDLDIYTNVVVAGRHFQIISGIDRRVEVISFRPDYESTHQVPIIDATIRHDDKCTGEIYVLKVGDALTFPAMHHSMSYHM